MSDEEGTYQMLWSCEYCDTQKLLALTHKHCPVCGAVQSAERRYYPEEGDEVSVAEHVFSGADVACRACDAPNSVQSRFCGSCGSDLEGAEQVVARAAQAVNEGERFATDSAKFAHAEHRQRALDQEADRKAAMAGVHGGGGATHNHGSRFVVLISGVVGLVVVLGLLCFGLNWILKKEVSVEAVGHEWVRSIDIEEYQTVRERAWRENAPVGGRRVSCTEKVQSHKKVRDGETCRNVRTDQGDGTFKKQKECTPNYKEVPVHGSWCTFELERWIVVDTASSQGGREDERRWPNVALVRNGVCVGCQREGPRREVLTVQFKDSQKGDSYEAVCSLSQWEGVVVGTRYKAMGRKGSSSVDCGSLERLD